MKAAFKEALEQEIAELEAMDIEIPEPTEEQRKEIKELLDRKLAKTKIEPIKKRLLL